MKVFSKLVLTFILIGFLFAAGCGSPEKGTDEDSTALHEKMTIFGGSVGGAWSLFTEGIAEAVRKEYPGTHISAIPGTVAGNPVAVSQGKTDFAIAESLTASFAYEGVAPFDDSHDNIRAVASIMPINVFQIVAPQHAPFEKFEDIVNNATPIHYSAGEKNALGDIISSTAFEAYNFTYDEIEANGGGVDFLSGGKSFELMADGRMDSLGKMVPIPAGDILEAAATIDMKLISIGETAIDHLIETYEMTPYTIEAGTYAFQKEDYETVNTPTILLTHEEMDEETVYHVTKSIYNQLAYLENVHNGFKDINDETIVDVGTIPLHPGAIKFFKEIGVLE